MHTYVKGNGTTATAQTASRADDGNVDATIIWTTEHQPYRRADVTVGRMRHGARASRD